MDQSSSFIGPDTFVSEALSSLIGGKKAIRALFITYNTVAGKGGGEVETGKSGLAVTVESGGLVPFFRSTPEELLSLAGMPADRQLLDGAKRMLADLGISAQRAVGSRARRLLGQETPVGVIAVVYAGVKAFPEAVEFAASLSDSAPGTDVVIVTCTCREGLKRRLLRPILEDGRIRYVVETEECGGAETMRQLLDALIEAWPADPESEG
ncbi:hypothetical protein AMJ57_03070 [Parcubacteria bacterium SG8_24]|nr:MAG: hypothetical protein AMJ57_03070 [Parcubacteria bacterium SG8_24]